MLRRVRTRRCGFHRRAGERHVDWRHSPSREIPYGGAYKGPQGVGQFFTRIGESLEVTSWEPNRVSEVGDDVMATGAWSAKVRPTGRTFAVEWAMVFGFRNGKISSFKVYEDTAVVAAAFRN